VFANNPAGWGFALASTLVKAENIRVISVGTGIRDFSLDGRKDGSIDCDHYEKSWKDSIFELLQINDTHEEKLGVASWLSAELIGKSVFEIQK